jgi:hypothetical protein
MATDDCDDIDCRPQETASEVRGLKGGHPHVLTPGMHHALRAACERTCCSRIGETRQGCDAEEKGKYN